MTKTQDTLQEIKTAIVKAKTKRNNLRMDLQEQENLIQSLERSLTNKIEKINK
jgi:predicted secreted Zn-dependent protease